jgi:carbon-monoxide dehydrogenase small subunit
MLRDRLGLTSVKKGCGDGECGACTVILNRKPINSCLMLAAEADGSEIITVEGLMDLGKLHPLQEAFMEKGALQCGFCTSGFLLSAAAYLEENPKPSVDEIRKAVVGNLCRCTGYNAIVDAIQAASRKHGGKS